MADMPMQDPAAQPPEQEQDTGGYTIEIVVSGDGTISVGVESAAMESQEAEAGGEESATPVKSIKEAIQIVLDIYKNQGQMQGGGEADFAAGFGQAPNSPGQLA